MSNGTTPKGIIELLGHYERLREIENKHWQDQGYRNTKDAGMDFPELSAVILAVSSEPAPDLSGFDHGWARHQSGVWWIINGETDRTASEDNLGPLLWGEWADEYHSIHLRPDCAKAGKLRFWSYAEREIKDEAVLDENGIPALCQKVRVLAEPIKNERGMKYAENLDLVYHVFWGATEKAPSSIRRLCYRFVEFDTRRGSASQFTNNAKETLR